MIDLERWPALVLAAGLATRLRPLSDVRAKAALPVAGETLIVRILRWLQAAGVRRVIVNLHHRPHTITREAGDGSALGLDIRYSWESEVLGSAGGPARALPLLAADRFLVINGDTLADVDLRALVDRHVSSGALATMAVVAADLTRYNALLADDQDALCGYRRRDSHAPGVADVSAAPDSSTRAPEHPSTRAPEHRAWHFIGVQAMNAAALAGVDTGRPSETVRELYPRLIARRPGSVRVFRAGGEFFDIGTPADYLETVRRVASREGRRLDRGAGCQVDPTATLDGTVLWDRVRVGAGAIVRDCVVADDVEIPAGARYAHSAIIRDAHGPAASPLS
jgi:NDP-sugar pyrophosphorylase family protein